MPFKLPLCLSTLGADAAPRFLRGRPLSGPAILEGLSCSSPSHVPLAKEKSFGWLVYVYFCPFLFTSAKPDRESTQTDVCAACFRIPQGKRLTWRSLRPPSFPTGWPPCFQNTKWRHVSWICRQREIGVDRKLQNAPTPIPCVLAAAPSQRVLCPPGSKPRLPNFNAFPPLI